MSVLMWIAGAAALGAGAIGWMRAEARAIGCVRKKSYPIVSLTRLTGFGYCSSPIYIADNCQKRSYYPIFHRWIAYCLAEISRKEECPYSG